MNQLKLKCTTIRHLVFSGWIAGGTRELKAGKGQKKFFVRAPDRTNWLKEKLDIYFARLKKT